MNRLVLGGLFALLLVSCANTSSSTSPASDLGGTVTWIIDGDSIRVDVGTDELEVRLLGINAPERGECFYKEATDYLIDTLKGKEVGLTGTDLDQYGRTLAHVWVDTRHINEDLVDGGYAIATTPDPGDPYGSRLLETEEEAFLRGAGLWSADSCAIGPIPNVTIDAAASNPNPSGSPESESIVIRNSGGAQVDLEGWVLRDESSRHRYSFSPGTRLGAGESLEVTSSDPAWVPGDGPVWNNFGDMALLIDPNGRVVDRWRY